MKPACTVSCIAAACFGDFRRAIPSQILHPQPRVGHWAQGGSNVHHARLEVCHRRRYLESPRPSGLRPGIPQAQSRISRRLSPDGSPCRGGLGERGGRHPGPRSPMGVELSRATQPFRLPMRRHYGAPSLLLRPSSWRRRRLALVTQARSILPRCRRSPPIGRARMDAISSWPADSDEVAQAFRFDGAQDSGMMAPSSRSLAGR